MDVIQRINQPFEQELVLQIQRIARIQELLRLPLTCFWSDPPTQTTLNPAF